MHKVMKKCCLLISCFLIGICSLVAQDSNQVRKYICDLSAPEMQGRGYAYNGDSIAAEYIRAQYQRMGIEPFGSPDYYNRYGFNVYQMEGPTTVILGKKKLTPWQDYALAPFSKSAQASYNIQPVKLADLLDQDRLLMICKSVEKKLSQTLFYVDLTKCSDKDTLTKVNRMFQWLSKYNGSFPFQGFIVGVKDIPVWSFNAAHESCDYILMYVHPESVTEKTKKVYLSYSNVLKYHKTQNVCAQIKGVVEPDSFIVVGGHYDHLGRMGDEVMFPGAHDNASGTATVLDMAQYFKNHPPYYTMVFTSFSGEEAGLLGSFAFVKDSLLDFSKIKMMFNIDLVCGGTEGFTMVNATSDNTKDFYQSLVDINEKESLVKTVKPRANAANSDHYPFVAKGIPAVFVYVMGGKTGGYHQPDDTCENCTLEAYDGIVRLLIKGLEGIGSRQ